MGADFIAVCHPRKEWIDLGRPLRQGGLSEGVASVLIYDWAGLPVIFLSDQGSYQDTYYRIKGGDVELYGHLEGCPILNCACGDYREVIPERREKHVCVQSIITSGTCSQCELPESDPIHDVR